MTSDKPTAAKGLIATSERAMCPHCGYDLKNDEPITIGDAHFDPARGFSWRGKHIHFSPNERIFVHTLMKAGGDNVTATIMAERLGLDDLRHPENNVSVYQWRIRAAFERAGIDAPFASGGRQGYRWLIPEQARS